MNTIYGTQKIVWLPDDEVNTLIKKSSNPFLLDFVYYFALRRSEVGLIKTSDVDKDGVFITALKRKKDFRQYMPIKGKRQKALQKYVKNHNQEYLFPGYNGTGISGEMVAHIWRQVFPQAGVHILRHSRAMWFSENKLPIEECSWWLRHASIQNTQIYYSISANRAQDIAQRMAS